MAEYAQIDGVPAGWRSARVQLTIVGLLAFCGPGLFNALNGLGSVGSSDPTVAAVANGCLYCTFAASSYFAGAAFNLFGPKPLFLLGGLAYAVYAVCVYFTPLYRGLAVAGGVILGLGAGLFWAAQGSLMMAYATPQSRGGLIALFWIIFNLGGVVGGLLQFALNYDNPGANASPVSYFAFVVAMLTGALISPCILAPPASVVREDGSAVSFEQAASPWEELSAALQAVGDPFVRRSLLFFLASNWFYTYNFSGFNASQFNMRTRGLNSALFWGAQMLAAWLFGAVLDAPVPPLERARKGAALVTLGLVISLGSALWINLKSSCNGGRGWDKGHPCELDYLRDSSGALLPMAVYVLLGAVDAIYQNFAYWLMSMAAGSDVRKTVMYSAVYKGTQSLGAGMAWFLDYSPDVSYRLQGIITLILTLGACTPLPATFGLLEPEKAPRVAASA
mmetsp:Transcript_105181/g.327919  ORF Transcript_105181/g.327919 Transcript_105181/m.327919 type:complete len:449 (-) Transcript_105181:101-1447(-)